MMDGWVGVLHPFQQYFSHIGMSWWWKCDYEGFWAMKHCLGLKESRLQRDSNPRPRSNLLKHSQINVIELFSFHFVFACLIHQYVNYWDFVIESQNVYLRKALHFSTWECHNTDVTTEISKCKGHHYMQWCKAKNDVSRFWNQPFLIFCVDE